MTSTMVTLPTAANITHVFDTMRLNLVSPINNSNVGHAGNRSNSATPIADAASVVTIGNISHVGHDEDIPYASKLVLIVLYTLTTVAAVTGNSVAILVFARGRRSNTDLRPFLINLAVADLVMAIFCIPFTFAYQITDNWAFSDIMCPIVQCCQVVSVTASVSTNTAIGIDRLVAVKFPLRKRVTNSYTRLVILFIWLFAGGLGVVPLLTGRTRTVDGRVQCEEQWSSHQSKVMYGFFIMMVTYFLPVIILSTTYAIIGRQLWRRTIPGNADDHRDAVQLKAKRKVVKMLCTIVLMFAVCWLPLHLFITIITFNINAFGDAANEIYFGVHWLSMANSFVNPVVYGFMNDNFRTDLTTLLSTCCRVKCHWRRRGIKRRVDATRRRLGDGHVHDSSIAHGPASRHRSDTSGWVHLHNKPRLTARVEGHKSYNVTIHLDVPCPNCGNENNMWPCITTEEEVTQSYCECSKRTRYPNEKNSPRTNDCSPKASDVIHNEKCRRCVGVGDFHQNGLIFGGVKNVN